MEKIFGTHKDAMVFGKSLECDFEITRHEKASQDGDHRKGFVVCAKVDSFSDENIQKYKNLGCSHLAFVVNEKTHSEHWFA